MCGDQVDPLLPSHLPSRKHVAQVPQDIRRHQEQAKEQVPEAGAKPQRGGAGELRQRGPGAEDKGGDQEGIHRPGPTATDLQEMSGPALGEAGRVFEDVNRSLGDD